MSQPDLESPMSLVILSDVASKVDFKLSKSATQSPTRPFTTFRKLVRIVKNVKFTANNDTSRCIKFVLTSRFFEISSFDFLFWSTASWTWLIFSWVKLWFRFITSVVISIWWFKTSFENILHENHEKSLCKNVKAYKSKLNTWKEYSMKAKHNFVRRTSLEDFQSYKIKVIFYPFQIGCLFSFALMLWIFPSRRYFFQFVSFVAEQKYLDFYKMKNHILMEDSAN